MKIYFENNGTYNQKAVGAPVKLNDFPIGYICDVSDEKVTCEIWNRYITKEPCCDMEVPEEYILSIGVTNNPQMMSF